MNKYGETFYATTAGDFEAQPWGTSTRKGNKLYLHVLTPDGPEITVPTTAKIKKATTFDGGDPVKFSKLKEGGVTITLPEIPEGTADFIIELETSAK